MIYNTFIKQQQQHQRSNEGSCAELKMEITFNKTKTRAKFIAYKLLSRKSEEHRIIHFSVDIYCDKF